MKKTYFIAAIILIIDQLSKFLVMTNFSYLESKVLIPNFFKLTYVKNTGGAFSILSGNVWLLTIIGIMMFFLLLKYIKKDVTPTRSKIWGWGLLLGGLLGNLLDRIIHRGVIDFLDFTFGKFQYPIFNIADIGIVIGVLILIIIEMRGEYHESRT